MSTRTAYRICPLCEATCGLELTLEDDTVVSVRGDDQDAFSEGYICPKGVALKALHEDPDRLRTPMIREGESWREAGWDEAFAYINEKLGAVIEKHGKDAVGVYLGNPTVHNPALVLYAPAFIKALGTKNIFSASSVDQLPKQLACALMFGTGLSVPIPDIDHTDYLMVLGANPLVSNGSLLTAPNIGERLKRIQQRGGKIVVLDPRRTETAKLADEHQAIVPGTDALFLFGIVHTLFEENLASHGRLEEFADGIEVIRELAADFTPEKVAAKCGIDAETIRRLARELAAAPSAAVYGRIGTCTQQFGTLASWLPEVIHYLTGNLDRPGGALFTLPAYGPGNTKGESGQGRGARIGRRKSRVGGHAEVFGEYPVACMAEEIETEGEGQVRALFTIAGNPLLSTPNGERLKKAVESLDFMVSLDIYLNETSRHADVILPGLSPLEGCHYDMAFSQLAVHNHARYSPAIFDKPDGALDEWETLLRLAGIAAGMGPDGDVAFLDNMVIGQLIQREVGLAASAIHGRDTDEILAALAPRVGPERVIDFMLRTGPHGEGFGANPDGLSLEKLEAHPHGIDLGPLGARVPEVLRTASGKIELAPEHITADVARLSEYLASSNGGMLLIGRRHLRSNNSWMHNLPNLVSGKQRCTLHIAPEDASRLGLADGGMARVTSKAGSVEIAVETTEDIRAGVVSIPHGWGHNAPGAQLGVAQAHAGVNSNILTDEQALDVPSGNAVLCGIPVEIASAN